MRSIFSMPSFSRVSRSVFAFALASAFSAPILAQTSALNQPAQSPPLVSTQNATPLAGRPFSIYENYDEQGRYTGQASNSADASSRSAAIAALLDDQSYKLDAADSGRATTDSQMACQRAVDFIHGMRWEAKCFATSKALHIQYVLDKDKKANSDDSDDATHRLFVGVLAGGAGIISGNVGPNPTRLIVIDGGEGQSCQAVSTFFAVKDIMALKMVVGTTEEQSSKADAEVAMARLQELTTSYLKPVDCLKTPSDQ